MLDLTRNEQVYFQELVQLETQREELRLKLRSLTSLESYLGRGVENTNIPPSAFLTADAVAAEQVGQLYDLQLQRTQMLLDVTPSSFQVKRIDSLLSTTRLSLFNYIGGAREAIEGANEELGSRLSAIESKLFRLPKSERELLAIERRLAISDKFYGYLLEQRATNLIARAAITSNANIIEQARSVGITGPDKPKTIRNYTLFGLALAAGIALQQGNATAPIDPWARNSNMNITPSNKLEGKGISIQIDKDLDYATLTSITSSRRQSLDSDFDADFSPADLLGENRVDYDIKTFTQELRLTSTTDGDLQWMVGLFHTDEEVDSERTLKYGTDIFPFADFLIGTALPGGLTTVGTLLTLSGAIQAEIAATGNTALAALLAPTANPADQLAYLVGGNAMGVNLAAGIPALVSSWYVPGSGLLDESFLMEGVATSVFTQLDYNLGDKTTVTLGLNYTEDKKTVVSAVVIDDPFAALPLAGGPLDALTGLQLVPPFPAYGGDADESGVFKSDDLTHTLRIAYDMNDFVTVYASHSTGFKASSVNLSVDGRTPGNRAADPEEATNVEAGIKTSFDNGYLNIAYFEQTIEGFQSNVFGGTGFNLTNAGEETHKGFELDSMFALSENLAIGVSAMYIDAIYDSFLNGTCDTTGLAEPEYACPAGQRTLDLSGRSPAGIHQLSYNINATYNFAVSAGVDGFVRVEYLHEKDVRLADLIPFSIANRGSDNLNASLGFSSDNGGWDAMLWGRNLTDHKSLISAFPTPAQPGSFSGYPNAPRTYGLTLRKNF